MIQYQEPQRLEVASSWSPGARGAEAEDCWSLKVQASLGSDSMSSSLKNIHKKWRNWLFDKN